MMVMIGVILLDSSPTNTPRGHSNGKSWSWQRTDDSGQFWDF